MPAAGGRAALARLCIAQFSVMAATYTVYVAAIALIESRTASSAQTGSLLVALTLPGFVGALLAGPLVDRTSASRAMSIGYGVALAAAGIFSLASARLNGAALSASAFACGFTISAIVQFTYAARDSLLPVIAAGERLLRANSILLICILGGQGAGTLLLAPSLVRAGGPDLAALVAAGLYLLAAGLSFSLPGKPGTGATERPVGSLGRELLEGWRFVVTSGPVRRGIAVMAFVAVLVLMGLTLLPGLAARVWGVPAERVSFLALPGGVGAGLALLVVSRYGARLADESWIGLGMLVGGSGLILLPGVQSLAGTGLARYVLCLLAAGGGAALAAVPARATVQRNAPEGMRGRVLSVQLFASSLTAAVGLPLVGHLADRFGFQPVFSIIAMVAVSAGALIMLSRRRGRASADVAA